MVEIRSFMRQYNELDDPEIRFKAIRSFGIHIKKRAVAMVSFILKLNLILNKFKG